VENAWDNFFVDSANMHGALTCQSTRQIPYPHVPLEIPVSHLDALVLNSNASLGKFKVF
jgi:hypothetical protein